MCTKEDIIFRATLILNNLRTHQSGADIHEVGEMRHTASLLIDAATYLAMDVEQMLRILHRLEKKQVEYFLKKYSNFP